MKKNILFILFISFLLSYSQSDLISNETYVTGDDGIIRMYVNVMGHVRSPGTYLVYDEIDLMTTLSMAGGYLQGADLKNLVIYRSNGEIEEINFYKYINSTRLEETIKLLPHDTIYIKEKMFSRLTTSSNLPTLILSLINILVTLEKSN